MTTDLSFFKSSNAFLRSLLRLLATLYYLFLLNNKDVTYVHEEITQVKHRLASKCADTNKSKQLLDECEQRKDELTTEITASEKKKFKRDAADYKSGRVYQWRNPFFWKKQGTRPESGHAQRANPALSNRYQRTQYQSTTDLK